MFDLSTGAGRELLKDSGAADWSLSPDGSTLAIFSQHQIRFFSLATGKIRTVLVKDWPLSNGDWGANGRSILMPSYTKGRTPVILEIDQSGAAKVALSGRSNDQLAWMIQSPNGQYALISKYVQFEGNAWILDHF